MTDRLFKPQRVAARLDCGITQAKFKMKNDLGGWYEPGIGWRCTERALNAFIASRAKGAQCDYPSSSDQPKPDGTGTATSAPQTGDAFSARSTSAPTELETQSAPPSPPIGRSKHGQQLDKLIAQSRKQHSAKRSTLSSASSKTPESPRTR